MNREARNKLRLEKLPAEDTPKRLQAETAVNYPGQAAAELAAWFHHAGPSP